MTKRVLGRGLEALLSGNEAEASADESVAGVQEISVGQIIPNAEQPRKRFDPDKIADLAHSIEAKGIIQPIVVRPHGERFQIIAGERRFLAAQQAGLKQVPVVVRAVSDTELLEWALIENIQRDDLDAIEEAEAFRHLIEDKGLTHDELSALVGRDRSSITNSIRLLKLSEPILRALSESRISAGHGRALLQAPAGAVRDRLFHRCLREGLSVRKLESLARGDRAGRSASPKTKKRPRKDPQIAHFEEKLRLRLGTRVEIKPAAKGGTVEIEFYSAEEFERVYEEIMRGSESAEQGERGELAV